MGKGGKSVDENSVKRVTIRDNTLGDLTRDKVNDNDTLFGGTLIHELCHCWCLDVNPVPNRLFRVETGNTVVDPYKTDVRSPR